ncbi:MAG: hypothetical protein RI906_975 [Pseudomonadota bacterium]
MVRASKRLHEWREPAPTRPAATILLVRDAESGIQVLMTRRSLTASFAPGAYVFPGGAVDASDGSVTARDQSRIRDDQDGDELRFATAAVREAFEELGILLACDADGNALTAAHADTLSRHTDHDLIQQLVRRQWRLALDGVWWFSHWITDRDLPKRFDARFFVARMPEGQTPDPDGAEQFEPVWVNPADGLARHERGEFNIIFPTIRTLRQLTRFRNVAQLIDHCRTQVKVWQSSPRAGFLQGRVERFCEDESPFGELELVAPDGQVVHTLDWQHEKPVPLLKHLMRLTAPNPGRMTGPGTNSYIVGEPGHFVVIDPGPDDFAHIARLHALVGKDLKAIMCTHAHPDHAPGARSLKALTGAPILGRPSGPDFNPAWTFRPDRSLHDGDRISVADSTLRVLHTPGHAEHHLCLLLEEDGLLFSGDHILNGSTTVIDPPDGNMRDYLQSLERLRLESFDTLLPAHGYVLGHAKQEIDRLIAHRLKREAKVMDALLKCGDATLDELVVHAYDDVPHELYPAAKRSLSAHLFKLREDGRADRDGTQRWYLR